MKTLSKEEFFRNFLDISKSLTSAELRMLYLLITEPEVIELSQQEFAKKIQTHRRTINIGLKKLKRQKYIKDIFLMDRDKNIIDHQIKHGKKNIYPLEVAQAKKFVLDSFKEYYYPIKGKSVIINEDFYGMILGDHRLHENFRYKKEFITESIIEVYPNCKFHFKQNINSYTSENHYNINHIINNEIAAARRFKRYYILKDKLLQYITDNFFIGEEEVLNAIKQDFPKVTIFKNRIRMPMPWKTGLFGH